jgi:hypothetical protein
MIVNFPETCTTDASRMAWCFRAQEKLRLVHNGISKWYDSGLSEAAYSQFPTKIKNRYPYKPQLSKADWDDFRSTIFQKVEDAIVGAMHQAIREAEASTYWHVDLDGDIN